MSKIVDETFRFIGNKFQFPFTCAVRKRGERRKKSIKENRARGRDPRALTILLPIPPIALGEPLRKKESLYVEPHLTRHS